MGTGESRKSKRVAVIFFPGRVNRKKLEIEVARVTAGGLWRSPMWLPTTADAAGGGQVREAAAAGVTHILAAGGDGTLREVLEAVALHAPDITVGIIAGGTGNVLARNLRLERLSLGASVKRGLTAAPREIDLCKVTYVEAGTSGRGTSGKGSGAKRIRHFATIAGLGLDAKIMMATNPDLKRKIGWVAYVEGGLKTLPVKFEKMRVTVDGREKRSLKVVSLLVGNVGWLPGKIGVMPDASLDDGKIDVAAIGPRRFWNWIDLWGRVLFGNRMVRPNRIGRQLMDATANVKTIENLSGKSVVVELDRPVSLQLDGDAVGLVSAAEFEVVPRAVMLRV